MTLDIIYKSFRKYLINKNKRVKKNAFSNYFSPIYLLHEHANKSLINGNTRYNLKIKGKYAITNEKSNIENNNKLNRSNEIKNEIKNFIDSNIEILPRETNENDITLNEIYKSFREHIEDKNISRNSFNNYFSGIYLKYPKSSKAVLNGSTRYNLKIKEKFPSKSLNNISYINEKNNYQYVDFSIKVGTAYKHKFLVLTRHEAENILPLSPYEEGCDIIVDNIPAKAILNLVPRLRILSDDYNQELLDHLEELSYIDEKKRLTVHMLLNKENNNKNKASQNTNLELQKEISFLKEENEKYLSKIHAYEDKINKINKKLEDIQNIIS